MVCPDPPPCKEKPNPISNLEKIKKAWNMGWSAMLDNSYVVISMHYDDGYLTLCCKGSTGFITEWGEDEYDEINAMEITNFYYAGELAGSEEIPLNFPFRLKGFLTEHFAIEGRKDFIEAWYWAEDSSKKRYKRKRIFTKSELKPYFR